MGVGQLALKLLKARLDLLYKLVDHGASSVGAGG
jgi:hypothetical protein